MGNHDGKSTGTAENGLLAGEEQNAHLSMDMPPAPSHYYGQISMVVREVENRYREGILAYMDVVAQYEEEIAALRERIAALKAQSAPQEAKLSLYAEEVRVEERMLERLNTVFAQKVASYEEFKSDYIDLVEKGDKEKIEASKTKKIRQLHDEIEESESKLLTTELERLNTLEKLQPLRQEIGHLEQQTVELERKKKHFETTHLQHVHMNPTALPKAPSDDESEAPIDTVTQ